MKKVSLWEKIESKELFITVKNGYPCCSSWLDHWTKHTGRTPAWCRGCRVRLPAEDLVGGHVVKVNSSDRRWYIVPLCSACNNSHPFEFKVKLKDLALADECTQEAEKMKKTIKSAYSFRITPELKEVLRRTAERKETSEGTIIRTALKNYFIHEDKVEDSYSFLNHLSHFPAHGKAKSFYEITQLEFEKAVANFHPDIRQILFGKNHTRFVEWLKKQPVFLQKRFRDTDDPEEAADIITRFKESNPSAPSESSESSDKSDKSVKSVKSEESENE